MEITHGKIAGAQKIVIYGPEGIGKSTFASHFPNPIFSDTEGSTKHMDVARLPKPSSWTMLLEQVRYIKANPQLCSTYVIDSADWAEQLCVAYLCAHYKKEGIEDFAYGKGYVFLAEEFGRLLNLLEELIDAGVNVVLTAHAKMRKFEQPDEMGAYDRWEMKLSKNTARLVKEWADTVLFANYKTYVINVDNQGVEKGKNKVQGGSRIMYTTHHPCWDAKNRDGLKPELPFEYKEIAPYIIIGIVSKAPTVNPTPATNVANTSVTSDQMDYVPSSQQKVVENTAPSASPANSQPAVSATSDKTTYWHDPQKCHLFTLKPGEQFPSNTSDVVVEIDEAEFGRLSKQYAESMADDDLAGIPKPLQDLMRENSVTAEEIQEVCFQRSYYPKDTPIKNYDPDFINGCLIGAWPQVFAMIKKSR